MLNQEAVEFVPGKLVTVRKAGPNGGKKKCRAVVCGTCTVTWILLRAISTLLALMAF